MSEAIAAVVFDLDGVLVDSESVWDAARREVVARNGGRWQADATRAMMGMSSPEWSRYPHDQLGVPLEPKQINELVIAALLDQYRRRLPLLPGAVVAVIPRPAMSAFGGVKQTSHFHRVAAADDTKRLG